MLDATRVFRLSRALGMNLAVMEYVEAAKLRGVDSFGMLCSARELQLSEDHGGLLELAADAVLGTIGGGALEYLVIDRARQVLREPPAPQARQALPERPAPPDLQGHKVFKV